MIKKIFLNAIIFSCFLFSGCWSKSKNEPYLLNGEVPENYYQSISGTAKKQHPLLAESGKNPYLNLVLNQDHTYQFNDGAATIKGKWAVKETMIILDQLGEGKGTDVEIQLRTKQKCLKMTFLTSPYEGLEDLFCPEFHID